MASSTHSPVLLERRSPPHAGVFTRLKPSIIDPDGIGVFAIRDIRAKTYLFEPDDDDLVWIPLSEISALPSEIKRIYTDFAIKRNGCYGCPANWNRMTISWYLNHSEHPNVGCDLEFRFFALRDIQEGEELSVDYRTYSDPEPLAFEK